MWKANFEKVRERFCMTNINSCPLCYDQDQSYKWSENFILCKKCGLIYAKTRLEEKELHKFYKGYNQKREGDKILDLQRQIMYHKDYKFITSMIPNPKQVLDVGAGSCEFLSMFKTSKKVGIEVDDMVKPADDCTLLRKFSYLTGKFDLIIFRGTLQYMRNLLVIKQIIDQFLADDGVLAILALPNSLSPSAQLYRANWVLHNPVEHINIFSVPTMKHMFPYYDIVDLDYPYMDTPYSNETTDVKKFVDCHYTISPDLSQYRHAFWGNMINIGLRRKKGINKMFNTGKTYVIAEIGINHNGDAQLARKLMDVAKKAGADCVKFQKRVVEQSFTAAKLAEPYTTKNSWGPTYGKHKHHLEFDEKEFSLLREYAKEIDIDFACTGCDKESVDYLNTLDMAFFKCASGDITNLPLLRHVASKGKPFVLSTGMSDIKTLRTVVNDLDRINPNFAILICTSTYPSPFEDLHLNNLDTFRKEFPGKVIGYSGHEKGFVPTIAAVAKGAKIVERHITMDRNMRGSDHPGSLEPDELTEVIQAIRAVELSLGTSVKEIRESEKKFVEKLSKSLVSTRDLPAGHTLTEDDLVTKHPGTGLSPMIVDKVIGSVLRKAVKADTLLTEDEVIL